MVSSHMPDPEVASTSSKPPPSATSFHVVSFSNISNLPTQDVHLQAHSEESSKKRARSRDLSTMLNAAATATSPPASTNALCYPSLIVPPDGDNGEVQKLLYGPSNAVLSHQNQERVRQSSNKLSSSDALENQGAETETIFLGTEEAPNFIAIHEAMVRELGMNRVGDDDSGQPETRGSERAGAIRNIYLDPVVVPERNDSDHGCRICCSIVDLDELDRCQNCGNAKHAACRGCLATYWEHEIFAGRSDRLQCIGFDECATRPTEADLQRVLSERVFRKYLFFLQKKEFAQFNVVFCAKDMCWQPLFVDSVQRKVSNVPEYYLKCDCCTLYTCLFCSSLIRDEELEKGHEHKCKAYMDLQKIIEKRKKKSRTLFAKLSKKNKEQSAGNDKEQLDKLLEDKKPRGLRNRVWYKLHTKSCPRCGVTIQKYHGCNHMTCSRCSYEFCWSCGKSYVNPFGMDRFDGIDQELEAMLARETSGTLDSANLDSPSEQNQRDENGADAFEEDVVSEIAHALPNLEVCHCADRAGTGWQVLSVTVAVILSPVFIIYCIAGVLTLPVAYAVGKGMDAVRRRRGVHDSVNGSQSASDAKPPDSPSYRALDRDSV